MFGEQALHPIEYTEHDWTREPWTGGGPVANYAPGHDDPVRPRDPARRSAACTGPAPRRRRTGPATWTAPSAPASGPPREVLEQLSMRRRRHASRRCSASCWRSPLPLLPRVRGRARALGHRVFADGRRSPASRRTSSPPQRPGLRRHLHQPAGRPPALGGARVVGRRGAAPVVEGAGPGPRRGPRRPGRQRRRPRPAGPAGEVDGVGC